MKIRTIAAALLLAAVALGGCMQLDSNAVIKKDGSGTFSVQISMSDDVAQALQQLKDMGGDTAKDMQDMPDFTSLDKSSLEKALKGQHCKLKSFSNKDADGKHTISFEIAFDDVQGLSSALAGMGQSSDSIAIYKTKDGNYLLLAEEKPDDESAAEDEPATPDKPEDVSKSMEDASKAMAIMGKLMAHAGELSIKQSITFPGKILENNATRVEGNTAYWEMDSSSMMSDHDMSPRVVFSGKGVKIDAPVKD